MCYLLYGVFAADAFDPDVFVVSLGMFTTTLQSTVSTVRETSREKSRGEIRSVVPRVLADVEEDGQRTQAALCQ